MPTIILPISFHYFQISTPNGELDFATLTPDVITNEMVISVLKLVSSKKSKVTWKTAATAMSKICNTTYPTSTIHTNFGNVEKEYKKRCGEDNRKKYLQEIYTIPKVAGKRKLFPVRTDVADEDGEPKRPRNDPFEQVCICLFI